MAGPATAPFSPVSFSAASFSVFSEVPLRCFFTLHCVNVPECLWTVCIKFYGGVLNWPPYVRFKTAPAGSFPNSASKQLAGCKATTEKVRGSHESAKDGTSDTLTGPLNSAGARDNRHKPKPKTGPAIQLSQQVHSHCITPSRNDSVYIHVLIRHQAQNDVMRCVELCLAVPCPALP